MQKVLYRQIEDAIRNNTINLKVNQHYSPDDIRYAIRWVMRDNPDIFWFAHQYNFNEECATIHFQYAFSVERVKTIQQSINDVIVNDFCIEYVKTLTLHEQIVYVYKWLVSYCNYNLNSAYNQSIYSVFVRRNSVCTAYAKAAQYLFNQLGIESHLIFGRLHNDAEGGRHCWNIVKADGEYYHFDSCFGDNVLDNVALHSGVHELFKVDGVNYNFLCVSTNEILKTRSIEDIETMPECPHSWPKTLIKSLAQIEIRQREGVMGCLLSHTGSTADIHLCSKDKNTVLKVLRSNCKNVSIKEYHYMQHTKGCRHILQCNEEYTDITQNIVAVEQSTPIVDLLCSHYYELSMKGVIKMATDVAMAWKECQERGVLYRDIHVCNIYRSNDGTFKLGDLGSCTTDFDIRETVGNQWFMAPETYNLGIFTERSAVYSISMVMYFILNNLCPAFWIPGYENEALRKRMEGHILPTPICCSNLPYDIKRILDEFFYKVACEPRLEERINSITEFIHVLEELSYYCEDQDYVIHREGVSRGGDLDVTTNIRSDYRCDNLSLDTHRRYTMGDDVERMCATAFPLPTYNYTYDIVLNERKISVDEVEKFAVTIGACSDNTSDCDYRSDTIVDEIEHMACTMEFEKEGDIFNDVLDSDYFARPILLHDANIVGGDNTFNIDDELMDASVVELAPEMIAEYDHKNNLEKKHITVEEQNKYDEVYSSIFAPAEVKRKSPMLVQVYLHLYEDSDIVKSLAKESDKNAERRDYIPLSLKLKNRDKVDIELNIYGETRLMSKRKSIIWQGLCTKCSFYYFIPNDINVDELCCEANLFVNGAMIGEMTFITQIVETPRNLKSEIISHRFNKIFISYAHQDAHYIRLLALAYKAQGVDYFYDRDSLAMGDVYGEKIFDYIDSADLFILCWSENAAKSDYVAKEKARALLRAYPQLSLTDATLKICPISIEPRADLPSDMEKIYNFEVL